MENNFFNELTSFSKSKLKPTTTKISYANGKQFIKTSNESEEKEVDLELEQRISNAAYWSKLTGYVVDLVPDNSIDEIIPHLYLSGDDAATNKEILDKHKITHVLNLTTNVQNKFEPELTYMKVKIYDLVDQKICEHFKSTFEFINNALKEGGSLLVHCNAGISRSATIVIAYLMQKRLFNGFDSAYEHVKSKRFKINPNRGFIKQLYEFEYILNAEGAC